jgi:autotransporter-associated beta strand protein
MDNHFERTVSINSEGKMSGIRGIGEGNSSRKSNRLGSRNKWLTAAAAAACVQFVPFPNAWQSVKGDVLVWTGAANSSWDNSSGNWDDTTTSTNPATYSDGSAVQFNDAGPGGTIAVQNVTGSPAGVSPASVEFTHTSGGTNGYTFTDGAGTNGIEGSATVTLDAGFGGTVYLDAANTFTGTTTVNGGTLELTNNSNAPTLGTGSVVLGGGILAFNHSVTTFANPISLTSGTSSSIVANASGDNFTETGTFTSGSTSTLLLSGGSTFTVAATNDSNLWSSFNGTVSYGANAGFLRYTPLNVGDAEGSQSDVVNLGSSSGQVTMQNSTGVVLIGALEGSATTTTVAGPGHSGNNTNNYGEFVIGGAGLNTTFNGTITQGSERNSIDITGGGSLTLTNGSSSYATKTGTAPNYIGAGTTILGNGQAPPDGSITAFTNMPASNGGGVLYVSNTTGSATGVSPVLVQGASSATNNGNGIAGGTLAGDGIIQGEVSTVVNSLNEATNSATPLANFAAGSHIAPGPAGSNTSYTLTLTGGLYLGDYANLDMSLDTTPTTTANSLIAVSNATDGSLANPLTLPGDGNIEVNFTFPNGAPETGVAYNLISYTGTDLYTGGTPASLPWTVTGLPAGYSVKFSDTGQGIDPIPNYITATFSVPEPGTIGLLAVGALGLLRRRRSAR